MAKKVENISAEAEKDISEVKSFLDDQPKVKIKIQPLKDRKDTEIPVGINGYVTWVPVGVSTQVPESVAEILENAGYI